MAKKRFISVTVLAVFLSQGILMSQGQSNRQEVPRAKKISHKMIQHGHERNDDYYWLNDPDNPEVIKYLKEENAYSKSSLSHLNQFREKLFLEMKSRFKKDVDSLPYKKGEYTFWSRYLKDKEYAIYYRKKGDGPDEVILNGNVMAKGKKFFSIGDYDFSADGKLMAYSTDVQGRNLFTIHIKNLETGEIFKDKIEKVSPTIVWANDNKTIFYVGKDQETLREDKVYRYEIGSHKSQMIFHEKDDTFWVSVSKSKNDQTIFIDSESTLSSETQFLKSDQPQDSFQTFLKRQKKLEYTLYDAGDRFYILHNKGAKNFKVSIVAKSNTALENWQDYLPHRKGVLIENFEIFENYLVIQERENGQRNFMVNNLKTGKSDKIIFNESAYSLYIDQNEDYDSEVFRFSYESLTTPSAIYDYNMNNKSRLLLKQQEVLGEFDSNNYKSERMMATVRDGVKVPISLVYKKGLKRDSSNPLLLTAYGSYGSSSNPYFSTVRLSLLNRGFIFAIAHVRGGSEMGRHWYEDGKLLKKKNTFNDFIDCAEHLVKEKLTSAKHLYANGGSAGGLLMGVVANMRPDLFNAILADVPFVDVVTTMLDESIPLTTGEFDEWGNPKVKKFYDYMLSYSPYDQIEKKKYPHMLVLTGLHDSQVQYYEPAKWVAKLREYNTGDSQLYIKIDMTSGHGGSSGRFESLKDYAWQYAFIFDLEGIAK